MEDPAGPITDSRPPDRVTYGEWEVGSTSKPVKKMVATRYNLFRVTEYVEVEEVHHSWHRKVTEWWDESARIAPEALPSASFDETMTAITDWVIACTPPRTLARMYWQDEWDCLHCRNSRFVHDFLDHEFERAKQP